MQCHDGTSTSGPPSVTPTQQQQQQRMPQPGFGPSNGNLTCGAGPLMGGGQLPRLPPGMHGPMPGGGHLQLAAGGHFMQHQSQIFVFSTPMANNAASAVQCGHYKNILEFHLDQPATMQFMQVTAGADLLTCNIVRCHAPDIRCPCMSILCSCTWNLVGNANQAVHKVVWALVCRQMLTMPHCFRLLFDCF